MLAKCWSVATVRKKSRDTSIILFTERGDLAATKDREIGKVSVDIESRAVVTFDREKNQDRRSETRKGHR